MSLLRKTPTLELNNYTHLLTVNENYLNICEKEKKETTDRYYNNGLSYEVFVTKIAYLHKEIRDTKKLIEKYKAKIVELNLLIK